MNNTSKKKMLLIVIALVLIGTIVLSIIFYAFGNVKVRYLEGVYSEESEGSFVGFGPCEANKLSDKNVIFVFTEPFTTLDDFEDAKIIKKVDANNGTGKSSLVPGKYGLYLEFENGDKRLYNDLSLENPKNDKPRNKQGPWYVLVNPLNNTFDFRESLPC